MQKDTIVEEFLSILQCSKIPERIRIPTENKKDYFLKNFLEVFLRIKSHCVENETTTFHQTKKMKSCTLPDIIVRLFNSFCDNSHPFHRNKN